MDATQIGLCRSRLKAVLVESGVPPEERELIADAVGEMLSIADSLNRIAAALERNLGRGT